MWVTAYVAYHSKLWPSALNCGRRAKPCRSMLVAGRFYVGYLRGVYCYVPKGTNCKSSYFFDAQVLCIGA